MAKKYLNKTGLSHFWAAIKTLLGNKQDNLVSGENIKTINNESVLGSGDIAITGRIIETGTANNGQYIKYDNGIMICTKTLSVSTAVVSAYFAGTYGTYESLGAMPATFVELWDIHAIAILSNTTDWFVGNIYKPSVSSMGTARICRPNASGNISGKINVFAIGTWK